MGSANDVPGNRQLLDTWMNERRRQLRIKQWNQVAARAGMSDENLRKIRRGEISITENAADGIEDALQWESGSVEAIVLRGEPPTPKESDEVPRTESATTRTTGAWTTEMEAFYQILNAKFKTEGLEMNEANVLSAIDQIRIELAKRAAAQDPIVHDGR